MKLGILSALFLFSFNVFADNCQTALDLANNSFNQSNKIATQAYELDPRGTTHDFRTFNVCSSYKYFSYKLTETTASFSNTQVLLSTAVKACRGNRPLRQNAEDSQTKAKKSKAELESLIPKINQESIGICDKETVFAQRAVNVCNRGDLSKALMKAGKSKTCDKVILDDIKELDLSENRLKTIPAGGLLGLKNLEKLNLSFNYISEISRESFSGLPNLKEINFTSNRLKTIPSDLFQEVSRTLELIDFGYNNISQIDENALYNIPNLKSFSLRRNELKNIPSDLFNLSYSKKLKVANFSTNSIQAIPEGLFDSVPTIEEVKFDDNEITQVSSYLLQPIKSLKILSLNDNKISSLPSSFFTGLDKLEDLSLTRNEFKVVPNLESLIGLKKLSLAGNNLHLIEGRPFSNLKLLEVVDLSDNNLKTLLTNYFENNIKLKNLDISETRITSFPIDFFSTNNELSILNLRNNKIAEIPSAIFVNLPNLSVLHLSKNEISTIKSNAFKGLISIKHLSLETNLISIIEDNAFAGLPALGILDIGKNKIPDFSRARVALSPNVKINTSITNTGPVCWASYTVKTEDKDVVADDFLAVQNLVYITDYVQVKCEEDNSDRYSVVFFDAINDLRKRTNLPLMGPADYFLSEYFESRSLGAVQKFMKRTQYKALANGDRFQVLYQ